MRKNRVAEFAHVGKSFYRQEGKLPPVVENYFLKADVQIHKRNDMSQREKTPITRST